MKRFVVLVVFGLAFTVSSALPSHSVSKLFVCQENTNDCYADTATWVPLRANSSGELSADVNVNSNVDLSASSLRILGASGDTLNVTPEGEAFVTIANDSVGLATESSLTTTQPRKITNQDTNFILVEDEVGIAKDGTLKGVQPREIRVDGSDTLGQKSNSLQVYNVKIKRSIFDEGSGDTLRITPDGEAKVDASVTVEGSNSIIVDDDGDTGNFALDYVESSPIHKNISPGTSETITFSEPRYRVSITPKNGRVNYSYTGSAGENSIPVAQLQRVDNSNLGVSQVTLYVPSSESSAVDVSVEVFD